MCLKFNSCCFCIGLKKGCLICGYLNLIICFAEILVSNFGLAGGNVIVAAERSKYETLNGVVVNAIMVNMLVSSILFLVFTIVLLVGLRQCKRGHVMAYLIYNLIFIVLFIIMFFAGLIAVNYHMSTDKVVISLISTLLRIYFLLVIRSYFQEMDDPANKPVTTHTTRHTHNTAC